MLYNKKYFANKSIIYQNVKALGYMKKPIFLMVICFILAVSCKSKSESEENVSVSLPDKSNQVKAFLLKSSDFGHELISNGIILAKDKADLQFQTSDIVVAIYVKNGARVVKGQKIASLDKFKLNNEALSAKDNLEKSRLSLQDVLIGQGYSLNDSARIPQEVMQIAKVKSNYDQALIQYDLAMYNLQNADLIAPFNGVVANLYTKAFNIPSGSEPFCTLIDNNNMEVEFSILESEFFIINTGDKVVVSPFALSGTSVEGNITEINPTVDKDGMIRVKAAIKNTNNKLYDGMNARIIIKRSLPNQLVIPKSALVLRSNRKVVFTISNNIAQWVYVETGFENSSEYTVTEGLAEGDSVIYEGNLNLAHKSPVELIKEE
jgi:membrane fusion protein (multidrug efflux system)